VDFPRFRFVDKVTAFDRPAGALRATCHVPLALDVFRFHFPDFPVLPGVYATEMMNQAAGLLLWDAMDRCRLPLFCQAKALHLRNFIRPGETVDIHVQRVHVGSGYGVVQARVVRDATPVADAELMFRTVPFPTTEFAAAFAADAAALLDDVMAVP
jgi:3-hydroxyacyl-[acyl-carrier-protein] dehydratase